MSAIKFVVRDGAGTIQRGAVGGSDAPSVVVTPGDAVSLNLRPSQVTRYERDGTDLKITLVDGSVVTIQGAFTAGGEQAADVYLSADGALQRVAFYAEADGSLTPNYLETSTYGKWSPDDDLFFVRGTDMALSDAEVIGPDGGDHVGMLGTALLGGFGALGPAAGLGAAALLGTAALGSAVATGSGSSSVTPPPNDQDDPDGSGGGNGSSAVDLSVTDGTVSTGTLVNGTDHTDGVTLTGTATPGATVSVDVNGVTRTATVGSDGTWTVTYTNGEVPGGTYSVPATVTVTDTNGNTKTVTDSVKLDTETTVSVVTATVETDGMVNAAELSDGVDVTGTAEAGATVVVTANGHSHTVTAGSDGSWTATFAASELPTGEQSVAVTAVATDAAGNSATTTGSFLVDTITNVTLQTATVETDGIINGAELSDGVVLTGTAQPGASVVVTANGNSRTVTAGADGSWSANFAASDFPTGEVDVPVSAVATDAAGNTASTNGTVRVDSFVNTLTTLDKVEGDDVINRADAADGIELVGTVEAGSSVVVDFNGKTYTATVSGGNWSLTIPAADVPSMEGDASATIRATDAAGNTKAIDSSFRIDTTVPEAPDALSVRDRGAFVEEVELNAPDGVYSFSSVDAAGTVTSEPVSQSGRDYTFTDGDKVPDGSHLIITDTETDSGNAASSVLVTNSAGVQTVGIDTNALSNFEVLKIDLDIADDSRLTLSAQQVRDLARTSDTLYVDGGADDQVTLTADPGHTITKTVTAGRYDAYDLGNGTTVYIDDDIAVTF